MKNLSVFYRQESEIDSNRERFLQRKRLTIHPDFMKNSSIKLQFNLHQMYPRILVIGAGPSGLSTLRAFKQVE